MTTVTFPVEVGGDGSSVSDDDHPTTGLAGGGHRLRFVAVALKNVVALANFCLGRANAAAVSASSAASAPGTNATSVTNIAAPAVDDSVAFALQQTGKLYTAGQTLVFSSAANALYHFIGILLEDWDSAAGTGHIKVKYVSPGWASAASWRVALSAPIDGTLTGRVGALEATDSSEADNLLFFEKRFT